MDYILLQIEKIAFWLKSEECIFWMEMISVLGISIFIITLFIIPVGLYLYRKAKGIKLPDY